MPASSAALKTTATGLDRDLVPYQLWRKAKSLGTWDPAAIDFDADPEDWASLSEREQDLLLRLTAQFEGGEESVTRDLLPLLHRVAAEGRIEEEMFLTSYLWEEAKHVEGFDRFLRQVTGTTGDLSSYFTAPYRQIMMEELPAALNRLYEDDGPEALAEASVTYQMIVEGVLAETGYTAYHTVLKEQDLLPGMQEFIGLVQRDESRHVAYGVFLLSRLVAEHGDRVWTVIEERMNTLLPLVLGHIQETLSVYGDDIPFGVSVDQFLEIGSAQFEKRLQRVERARSQTLEDVLYGASGDEAERTADARPVELPGSLTDAAS
jgi:ribonucleoside-diphosphate reductase beta chain